MFTVYQDNFVLQNDIKVFELMSNKNDSSQYRPIGTYNTTSG